MRLRAASTHVGTDLATTACRRQSQLAATPTVPPIVFLALAASLPAHHPTNLIVPQLSCARGRPSRAVEQPSP